MVQYVVRLPAIDSGTGWNVEMATLLEDLRLMTAGSAPGEVRDVTPGEMDAFADWLSAMRDLGPTTEAVTYHVCRHDEGIGSCAAVVK